MGGRRRRTAFGQVQLSFASYRDRLGERRTGLKVRCGVFFVLITLVAACATQPLPAARSNTGQLIVGFPEAIGGADLGPGQFIRMLSQEGLMASTNVDGRPLPELAERAQWENGGLRLRFILRPGVVFHDGTPMTAPVVAEILRAGIAAPDSQAAYSSFADVSAVQAVGDMDVVIDLSQPSAFLLEDLTKPLSLRRDVGAGPFRVIKRDPTGIVLERFERYYQGAPSIQRVEVKSFDALRTAWSSLLRGEVDMVTDIPAEAVEFIRSDEVDVIQYKRWYQYIIAFNSTRGPLQSPLVRQSLNWAVDRDALIQRALRGFGAAATGPLWPRHWAYDTSISAFGFEQRLATAQLDRAGRHLGDAGANSNVPHARFKFTCLVPADFSVLQRLALEVQKQLYDVGVDMQFEVVSFATYDERLRKGQFEAALVDMISGPSFGRPYIFWRSAKNFDGFNKFGYENSEAERLFGVLRASALDEAQTRSATHSLQRVFLDDPPALFLAWSERARVVGPKFTPVTEPDGDPVQTMWRWTAGEARLASSR
jgi:peptide/nickel transport system substrate-binding protein